MEEKVHADKLRHQENAEGIHEGPMKKAPEFGLTASPVQMAKQGDSPYSLEVPWEDGMVGDYPAVKEYGIGTYGKHTTPLRTVKYVVLHSTGPEDKTWGADEIIHKIDAHFEVAKNGTIYKTTDKNLRVEHSHHPDQENPSHPLNKYSGINAESLSIEFVNEYTRLVNGASSRYDKAGIQKMRNELSKLSISPKLKAYWLGLSDSAFFDTFHGEKRGLYADITAKQKRSAYELKRNLEQGYPDAEFIAHEKVSHKKPGEGENTEEFLETIDQYNLNLRRLQSLDPSYWVGVDAQKVMLLDQAKREMKTDSFYAEFYKIAGLADRILGLGIPTAPTSKLASWLNEPVQADVGMFKILRDFKRHLIRTTFQGRNISVYVEVTKSTDGFLGGKEDIYVVAGDSYRSEVVKVPQGTMARFQIPISKVAREVLDLHNLSIKVQDSETIDSDRVLFDVVWDPLKDPTGLRRSNAGTNAVTIQLD